MNKHYLLRYSDNWADEMDIDGHVVLTEEEYMEFSIALDQIDSLYFGIGTNEDIEYDSNEAIRGVIEVVEITEQEVATLARLDLLSLGFAESLVERVIEKAYDVDGDTW